MTEEERKAEAAERRAELEAQHGQVWDTNELTQDFKVHAFALGQFVQVTRKEDGAKGLLTFDHRPRFYYNFQKED